MMKLIWAGIAFLIALWALDRLLLWTEKRGWLYYRRKKPNLSGSIYHMLEMHSVFDPGIGQVQEIIVEEEQQEDESGEPPTAHDSAREERSDARESPHVG